MSLENLPLFLSFGSLDDENVTDCCVQRLKLNSELNSTSYLLSQERSYTNILCEALVSSFCPIQLNRFKRTFLRIRFAQCKGIMRGKDIKNRQL